MTAPLSQYFIYTSHNTYLTGNQLSSDCSDVPIIQALQRGVRGIELDLWPNSEKDNVNVLHGRTLTTPVELVRCLRSIGDHAFCASEYPVIIILEDHLTPDLLAKVAEMVTQTFGEMLFSPGPGCVKEFPSLEALKHRIIMSKPAAEYLEDKEFEGKQSGYQEGQEAPDEAAWGKEVLFVTENDDLDEGKDDRNEEDLYEVPEYKRIIGIHAGKGKGGLQDWLRVDSDKVRRLSLSELELEKASINHGEEIVRFTQQNLLRVYPKGIRINSSNYNPVIGWMHGVQMVAFNMQGYGRSYWSMHGMFKANGGCGYIKKPNFLLKNNDIFDPKSSLQVRKTLKVTAYMGEGWYFDFRHTHFDAYPPPDIFARVGIAGVTADTDEENKDSRGQLVTGLERGL
ncbi:Phosphoinositide phospholipase C [Bertholletia excelsa]